MNSTDPFPDENDIHAYVDGHLDETDGARMDVWLERHPERADDIRRWRRDAQQLRAVMGGLPDTSNTSAFDPAMIRARRRHRARARMATAAMLVLALGVGGVGGWQVRSQSMPTASAPMADAREAYRMFAMNQHVQFDVTPNHADAMQTWLNKHFRSAPPLPDFAHAGFHPVGGRLLATGSGPAAIVLYKDGHGDAISFYIRPPSKRRGTLPRGHLREGKLATAYWSGHGYNYALVSRIGTPGMHAINAATSI